MKSLEWYLKNDKDKLKDATVRLKSDGREVTVVKIKSYAVYTNKILVGFKYELIIYFGLAVGLYKSSDLELVGFNNNNNINEEIYKTMEVNVINNDVIKANTAIKVMWQGDDFAYNCIVQYSTGKYIHCYGLGKTNKIERYAISADDLESGKIQILEIMKE